MEWSVVFAWSGVLVMPVWALLFFAPRWSVTRTIASLPWVALPAALLYVVLVIPLIPEALPILANPALEPIAALLGSPAGATIAWVHFLAFDLFIGCWIHRDALERGLSAWLLPPILACVLMFGPMGLVVYLLVRAVVDAVGRREAQS